jgi:5-methylcytosine-specific restriction endonuclease McrA
MFIKITEPENWYSIPSYTELRQSKNYEWVLIRKRILERDKNTCVYCGIKEDNMHVDHVFPESRGGTDEEHNLVCACRSCNCSKRDRTPEEWLNAL